ncbi:MAG TPA: tetratricopeptide repeat protein [Pyrinomonadaceae bacterium]
MFLTDSGLRRLTILLLFALVFGGSRIVAQEPTGGGSLVRDILGGAPFVFRRPDNPPVNAVGGTASSRVGGGRTGSRTTTRAAAPEKERVIARANAARSAPSPRFSEAEEGYRYVARLDPTDPRAQAGLGNVYIDQKRFTEAVTAYRAALKLNSNYAAAYMPLGYGLIALNKHNEAIEIYQQALTIDPNDPEIYNNLGYAFNHLGKYVDSVEACKRAIELLGQTGQAYKQGHQERDEVLTHAYKNLGNAYNGQKLYPEAIEALRHATELQPTNAAAFFNLGLAHYNAGQNVEAVDAYKQVLKLKPKLPAAHYNLGLAYIALKGQRSGAG